MRPCNLRSINTQVRRGNSAAEHSSLRNPGASQVPQPCWLRYYSSKAGNRDLTEVTARPGPHRARQPLELIGVYFEFLTNLTGVFRNLALRLE